MSDVLTLLILAVLVVVAALVGMTFVRLGSIAASREAVARESADIRMRLEVLKETSADFERDLRQDLATARGEQAGAAQAARSELAATLARQAQLLQQQLGGMAGTQADQLQHFGDRLSELTKTNEQRLEAVRATVEQRLDVLRNENAQKLDQMRATVDEKLQTTLDERLGQSFKQVSDRLEQVHKGLGEMQTLAAGVGDLRRVLTNVKSRGGWGEVQLGTLLAELLTPTQYAQNVATRPGSKERVEFAVKFPGRGEDGAPCWLPIDAKFPLEDYQRLQDAIENADAAAVEASRKAMETFFKTEAKSIRDKYIEPPHTLDFAILFVPTEGLYAEAVSRPGLADSLQRDYPGDARGTDEPPGDAEQPAARLPHAGDRAALDRSVARAGGGQDRVRQVRRDSRANEGEARPGRPDARRRRAQEHDDRAEAPRRGGIARRRGRPPADRGGVGPPVRR